MKWTKNLPDKEGYYWWADGEGVEMILKVDAAYNTFYASNEEYGFVVGTGDFTDEKWCFIPKPE